MPFKSCFGRSKGNKDRSVPNSPTLSETPSLVSSEPSLTVSLASVPPYRSTGGAPVAPVGRVALPAPTPGQVRPKPQVPRGWAVRWDPHYHAPYYVNEYPAKSQWTVPLEPPPEHAIHVALRCREMAVHQRAASTPTKTDLRIIKTADTDPQRGALLLPGAIDERANSDRVWQDVEASSGLSQREKRRGNHNIHVVESSYTHNKPIPTWYSMDTFQMSAIWRRVQTRVIPCETCRYIELDYLFHAGRRARTAPPEDYICLGPYREISRERGCELCCLITATIETRIKLSETAEWARLDVPADRLRKVTWYLSPFVYSHPDKPLASYNLLLQYDVFDVQPSESSPFGIRLITDAPRGGREIPEAHLDFAWLRSVLDKCEINTDAPPIRFDHPSRVIDTQNMCIVDLDRHTTERYVALSYPWGNVKRLRLLRTNEQELRQPGAIQSTIESVARTIRDAIVLVTKIGERYLWVHALCVMQDDPSDKQQQIGQVGEIYRHSYLGVFAVSGHNADYGLPGVRKGSRALVQRRVVIGDHGMHMNCLHITSPEDEHCWHPPEREDDFVATGDTVFFNGLDRRCEPFLGYDCRTPFDYCSMFVYEYSQRQLTYDSDALPAFSGIIKHLKRSFAADMLSGVPEAEFDAGLLWSPIGAGTRRPEFPSWSWLGWTSSSCYYWTHERDTFLSIQHSPLEWLDAWVADEGIRWLDGSMDGTASEQRCTDLGEVFVQENPQTETAWFTSDDLCLPKSGIQGPLLQKCRTSTDDSLGVRRVCAKNKARWRAMNDASSWPLDVAHDRFYTLPQYMEGGLRLTFRTLTAEFEVSGVPFKRERLYNLKESTWRLAVRDRSGAMAGYIDIAHPSGSWNWKSYRGKQKFVALSRSTIDGKREPGPDSLDKPTTKGSKQNAASSKAEDWEVTCRPVYELSSTVHLAMEHDCGFDASIYSMSRPWCTFNVMMVQRQRNGVMHRSAIGRIHVDAFLGQPTAA